MRSYHSNTAFLDILFNSLLCFVFLFVLSFSMIEPDRPDGQINTKAEFIITVTWPEGLASDVDTWVEDPLGNIVYFKDLEAGLMHLDRDDLGFINDSIVSPTGQVLAVRYNEEIVSIRGFIPGEWTINLHLYNKRDRGVVKVRVRMDKINPNVQTILNEEINLTKRGEERTVARFTMDGEGNISNINQLPKALVKYKNVLSSTVPEDNWSRGER